LNADRIDGVHAAGLLKKKDYDPDRDGSVVSADTVEGVALDNLLPGGVLPAGSTLRGVFAIGDDDAGYAIHGVEFGYTLASAPTVHYIEAGAAAPAECPGSVTVPQAAPGHLCVYEAVRLSIVSGGVQIANAGGSTPAASPFGFMVVAQPFSVSGLDPLAYGGWAVTAPTTGAAPAPTPHTADSIGSR
jgi:hypothetical protein